jgi:hypothetical protein
MQIYKKNVDKIIINWVGSDLTLQGYEYKTQCLSKNKYPLLVSLLYVMEFWAFYLVQVFFYYIIWHFMLFYYMSILLYTVLLGDSS